MSGPDRLAYLLRCTWPGCRLHELVDAAPSACAEIGDAITGHLLSAPRTEGHRVVVSLGWAGHRSTARGRRYHWFTPTPGEPTAP